MEAFSSNPLRERPWEQAEPGNSERLKPYRLQLLTVKFGLINSLSMVFHQLYFIAECSSRVF